jgi:hypothetical protein
MAEPVAFLPTPESRRFARLFGCLFAAVGGLLAGGFLLLGLVILSMVGEGTPEAYNVMGGALCCGTPFGLMFVAVGLWVAFFAGRNERLVLDDARLTYKERALPLDRVARVSVRQGWQRRVAYWMVVVEDDAGGTIELEVTQDSYVGTFDARAVLRALLPRLPAGCAVEPRVRGYAQGARLE